MIFGKKKAYIIIAAVIVAFISNLIFEWGWIFSVFVLSVMIFAAVYKKPLSPKSELKEKKLESALLKAEKCEQITIFIANEFANRMSLFAPDRAPVFDILTNEKYESTRMGFIIVSMRYLHKIDASSLFEYSFYQQRMQRYFMLMQREISDERCDGYSREISNQVWSDLEKDAIRLVKEGMKSDKELATLCVDNLASNTPMALMPLYRWAKPYFGGDNNDLALHDRYGSIIHCLIDLASDQSKPIECENYVEAKNNSGGLKPVIKKEIPQGGSVLYFNTDDEVNRLFDESSVSGTNQPTIVIIMGGVAAGKTTTRKKDYSEGYVLIDAADIFLSLSRGAHYSFPDQFEDVMSMIGEMAACRAINERRNIVTEIIGADDMLVKTLTNLMIEVGYKISFVYVECEFKVAMKRNEQRENDCISAYYAEKFQIEWLIDAAKQAIDNLK